MLEIKINSPVPIYEQLIDGIRKMIDKGDLEVGESLPSIRNLASTLEVASNTVARAYNELERLGYLKSFGVKGTFVSDRSAFRNDLVSDLKAIISKLRNQGYSTDKVNELVTDLLNEFEI